MEDQQALQPQVLQRDAHGGREGRGIHSLEFDTQAPPVLEKEEVQLGSLIRRPEVRLVRPNRFERLFQ